MVELPADLADQFWLFGLAGYDASKLEGVRAMSVRDAILCKHLAGYSAHLEQKHLKQITGDGR